MSEHGQLGTVIVRRKEAPWRDRARAYKVIVDGKVCGSVANGDAVAVQVPPGDHGIRLKIDFFSSATRTFSVSAGESVRFDAEPNGNSFTVLLDVLLGLLRLKRYIRLVPAL